MSRTPQTFVEAVVKATSVTYKFKISPRQNYDNFYWKQKWQDRTRKRLVRKQMFDPTLCKDLGPDLAAANFVMKYCRGTVKTTKNRWYSYFFDLPRDADDTFKLSEIRATDSGLLSEAMDHFVGLDALERLDLSGNTKLDNFACDQLARQFRDSKTLRVIDLSHNPRIDVYGLEVLFRIPSLKTIRALGTGACDCDEIDLFVMAAQEERQCKVYVHGDGRMFKSDDLQTLLDSIDTTTPLLEAKSDDVANNKIS